MNRATTIETGTVEPATRRRREAGYTLVEMVVVVVILAILAAVALPVSRYTSKRLKEAELRQQLRSMRYAIDEYKRYTDAGLIPVEFGTEGYPQELETLIEPVEIVGQVDLQKKFMRRIPEDPMTGETEWGMRSYQDEPDSTSWGGENVYDVYSLSEGVGLNGVPYTEW
ncbi:MAG TPA: prepilin-type N-terminal cleavage/methylation domain-containing protein [Thermoanaerobaculia bacterium]|nr:prepilin-type N-terminal cleavage/methylation domain-containing protein [Thermoanaerobaculia bacterium]